MKILVLLTDAFGGLGGIAKFNRDLLTALCLTPECEQIIAVPRLMPNRPEPFPNKLTYITSGLNHKFKYISTAVITAFKNRDTDLIICGHINLIPVAFLIRILIHRPVMLVMHGVDVWQPTKSLLVNYLVKKIDFFISVSEFTKNQFLTWCRVRNKPWFILPNCVQLDKFKPGEKNSQLLRKYGLEGKKILMTLARLDQREKYKGFDEILEILPDLSKTITNIAYLIVGDGSDRARLEKKAETLGVCNRVVFAGFIPEAEKADHYRLADVFVMPGRGEGFGIVYLEALACGIPVVASKLDGSREAVLDGKLGVLVDPRQSQEIKTGIEQALKSKKISPDEIAYFSFDHFCRRAHLILKDLLHRKTNGV